MKRRIDAVEMIVANDRVLPPDGIVERVGARIAPMAVEIELAERGAGTELTLTHQRLPRAKVEAHREGWTDIVRKLEAALGKP